MTTATSDADALRTQLGRSLGPVLASDLTAHLKRDGVIVVSANLSLIECAVAIARDDSARVAQWMKDGVVRRANDEERERWPSEQGRQWLAIVVQPFVLVQEILAS